MSGDNDQAKKDAEKAAAEAAEKTAAQARKEAAAAESAEKARLADEAKILVKMTKNGEELSVHPTCVKDHESLGWKRAE
jgi:hypothetical protein